jgi:hypothetical protein
LKIGLINESNFEVVEDLRQILCGLQYEITSYIKRDLAWLGKVDLKHQCVISGVFNTRPVHADEVDVLKHAHFLRISRVNSHHL